MSSTGYFSNRSTLIPGTTQYLKLIVHSKSVLVVYFILILVTFMMLGEIIYNNQGNEINVSKNTKNGIYAAIVIAGIINMFLIYFGMRTRNMAVSGDSFQNNPRMRTYGKLIYSMFTVFQILILILTVVILIIANPKVSTSTKSITVTSIILINVAIIIYIWAFALSSCSYLSSL